MNPNLQHIRPLTLPTLCAQHARIRSTLAGGLSLPFTRDGLTGRLHLQLANTREQAEDSFTTQVSRWRSDIGHVSLADPFPVLSLLSDCPLLPLTEDDNAAQEWYWTLYNQSLNPVLRMLIGEIYPLSLPQKEQDSTEQNHNAARLSVSWNGITVRSRMQAADAVWLALFSRADWHHQRRALPAGMTIAIPLTLADAVLPLSALRRLRTGDLILPNRPWFTPSGEGTLSSGTLRLRGTLQLTALAPYTFTVTDMETVSMPATDTMLAVPHSDASALEHTPTSDNVTENLPPLPVTLHIRCGSLTMTLTELQHLASGSVLTLRDVVQGQAWLYHGDIALASGDLVDVEGRLGLQITQCFSAPAHELPIADEEYAAEPELAP
ncbi:YscQ/HrcQ family type III secretion apparatus protein [Pectobacterium carotovorum subsp. carotovorum]|uniref:HrcQ n=1 Tax=Pectobacterium carotovorum subsp. carotovorum TaxID=555 RepID=Q6WEF3_PECCC|nr:MULTISPECIES: type III secretion system cytoplasmic ring protein SctQ [Pectobacterium]AAQ73904.1 HrcQ [Pectobacterium carotovorum subsp. carotovorum]ASN85859.1 Type III secretion protein HrcQ [Pectobacterium versatile]MBQ4761697.1 YscQ/HrcQ family type III secretion apparatus protein [Pectobacterium versatile]MCL6385624.1 YscQ/HrcQ family type III secretion apparatus protein [Pectobacterium carotovorum subsp. carotovorum]TAI91181.1 YscQ/HrcQ family type III secretion apparatus protein [Pect